MPYMDETGLAYYSGKLKPWIASQPVKTIPSSLYPWTLTAKAGAVTCWPVGGTELKPTVDFMFSETGPASGDKGPSNPSTISGVSEVKAGRCGENLYNVSATPKYTPSLPSPDNQGFIDFSTTNTSSSAKYFTRYQEESSAILSEKTYTLAIEIASIASCGILLNMNPGYSQRGQLNTGYKFLDSIGTHFVVCTNNNIYNPNVLLRLMISVYAGATAFIKFRVSVFEGVVDAKNFTYEPYEGTDYTLPLDSTYYGGSIDLATGVMTVTHVAVTPDASTVDISSAPAALPLDYADTYGRTITSADGTSLVVGSTGGTVVYKLSTPQTVQLTPTQILSLTQTDKYTPRLNTVYTDASAVQVGYVKSPIREEFELQQAIVAQGGSI